MKIGLYEEIVSLLLTEKIKNSNVIANYESLEIVDSHEYLAQYLYKVLAQGLAQVKPEKELIKRKEKEQNKLQKQINICNEIIQVLQSRTINDVKCCQISDDATRLVSIIDESINTIEPLRPDTPLALGALLTGTRSDPSLVSQIKKEIASANQIDMLVSFIKWSGIMLLKESLEIFTQNKNNKIRIITTSYMGATDLKAIKWLQKLPNTEIKVSYDSHRTRLHAKAYCFYRNTKFSSAYVGSANLSQAAFTDGLEWTVKISQYEQPYQWQKIIATFETYWNDSEFEIFKLEDIDRLHHALSLERNVTSDDLLYLPAFDLKPYSYQQEILDQVQVERHLQQRQKHLIIAATGTGKTIIAAFDFKLWRQDFLNKNSNREPNLLFIAHRKEILKQSLSTFRIVLRNQNYADLMVDGIEPQNTKQLFISIQMYNSRGFMNVFDETHYDYIVIDEFHHAAARSYQSILNHVSPSCLMGLTATPERADGESIIAYFDDHITAEIRLPDAINRKLLSPFHYYGISDIVDFSTLQWARGGYAKNQLNNLVSGNDFRAQLIIDKTVETVLDITKVRGLGFCVSKVHAEFMARKFSNANIPSEFLIAESSSEHRHTIQRRLIDKQINFIFVVDLYNEGIDIPEIDTVIFLRPTESLTVFLQQLGRGLRLHDGKDCLTVLDFIGQSHKNFRYDLRFTALISNNKRRIDKELNNNFPHLPAGCSIQFEREAKRRVLENINAAIFKNKPRIIQHITTFTRDTGLALTLDNFLNYYQMPAEQIYKSSTWSRLCVSAGESVDFNEPDENQLTKGFRRLLHINDIVFINKLLNWLKLPFKEEELSENDIKYLTMLHFTLWNNKFKTESISESFKKLNNNPTLKKELIELLQICRMSVRSVIQEIKLSFDTSLKLHGRYTLSEILSGLGHHTLEKQPSMREGVLHLVDVNTSAFFVTLNKSEKHYSPTTLYKDYAINERLFHWQSQSTISDVSPTGQRYIHHIKNNHNILIFVRENRKNNYGSTEPYYFLGPAKYISHKNSRPISFIWEFEHAIPAYLIRETAHLVTG